jgi:hypothetical protein
MIGAIGMNIGVTDFASVVITTTFMSSLVDIQSRMADINPSATENAHWCIQIIMKTLFLKVARGVILQTIV